VVAKCRCERKTPLDDETISLGHSSSSLLRVHDPIGLPSVLRIQVAIDNDQIRLDEVESSGHEFGGEAVGTVCHELRVISISSTWVISFMSCVSTRL